MSDPRYRTARWLAIRRLQLQSEPLCRMCRARGKLTPATVADHVTPHRGDAEVFWNGALQSLCATCHSGAKQAEERGSGLRGCDVAGAPLDPSHPWNAAPAARDAAQHGAPPFGAWCDAAPGGRVGKLGRAPH